MKERMKAALVLAGLASLFSGLVIFTLLTLIAIWTADARWFLTGIVGSGFFCLTGLITVAIGKEGL